MSAEAIALEARDLSKRYGSVWGLRECSFQLPAGRIIALVGSNGAGKSTLMSIAAGLLPATSGVLTAAVSAESDHLAHVYAVASGESLFAGPAFLVTGMVPLVLSVVWFAVNVALGVAFRRTLPAIFASVAGSFGLSFFVQWRYPTFVTPLTTLTPVGPGKLVQRPLDPNALQLDGLGRQLVDAAGHPLSPAAPDALCPSQGLLVFRRSISLAVFRAWSVLA